MNSTWLYRKQGRSIFWIAFVSALAIHIAAVALARTKAPIIKLERFTPGAVDIVDVSEPEPLLLEESVPPPPLEQIQPEQDSFKEENLTPPPVRTHRKTRTASLVRGTTATTSLRLVKAMVTYAPRPVYPYEARRQRVTGSGVALLTVDQTSGTVTDVIMAQSCGNAILDNSTLDALRSWRFKPGTMTRVQVPITYNLMGVSY
jgi:TonB family protein